MGVLLCTKRNEGPARAVNRGFLSKRSRSRSMSMSMFLICTNLILENDMFNI